MRRNLDVKQSSKTHQAQLPAGKHPWKAPSWFLCFQGGEVPPHGGELEVGGGWNFGNFGNFGRARGADRGGEDGAGARGAGGWSCRAQGIRQPHGR